jgi:hypothetical protein
MLLQLTVSEFRATSKGLCEIVHQLEQPNCDSVTEHWFSWIRIRTVCNSAMTFVYRKKDRRNWNEERNEENKIKAYELMRSLNRNRTYTLKKSCLFYVVSRSIIQLNMQISPNTESRTAHHALVSMLVLWVVTPSWLVGEIGELCFSIFRAISPKPGHQPTRPHGGGTPEAKHRYSQRRENLRFHLILVLEMNEQWLISK